MSMASTDPDSTPRRRYAARQPVAVRREQILDAAFSLVAEVGWPGTSMDRIAERAGVAKSVSYKIFGSQAELQLALMERAQQVTSDRVTNAIHAATEIDTMPGAVAAALQAYLESVAREPEISRLVLLPIEGAPSNVLSAIRDGRERVRQQIESALEHQLARIGADGIDVELIAHLTRDTAEALARLLLEHPETFTPQRLMHSIHAIAENVGRAVGRQE